MAIELVLASASPSRRKLLENAGLAFRAEKPQIDERAVEQSVEGSGLTPADLAQILAETKAADVGGRNAAALVIGSDQVMALDDRIFHKPADMDAARRNLLALSGRTHQLHSAVAIVSNGETLWRHVETANMSVRRLQPAFVGHYLAEVGDAALQSVGAYQVEGRGIQLFDRIEGDFFSIVGLPLLPLLTELRRLGAIDG